MKSYRRILFNVPNLIGYFRLILAVIAWINWEEPKVFLPLFLTSCALDFIDGIAARSLNQTSAFGTWLDVVIDNLTRGMIWSRLYQKWSFVVPALEWLTFVCTHQLGRNWKQPKNDPPKLVSLVMADNFDGFFGLWAILSVWLLPLLLYCMKFSLLDFHFLTIIASIVLVGGRLLAFFVEAWFITQHIIGLLDEN